MNAPRSSPMFGSLPAPAPMGGGNTFGAPPASFGAAPTAQPFGAQPAQTGGFGAPAPTSGFGAPQSTPMGNAFGAPTGMNPAGAQQPATGFGGTTAFGTQGNSGFGTATTVPTNNGFNTQPQPSAMSAPSGGFGTITTAPAAGTFGAPQTGGFNLGATSAPVQPQAQPQQPAIGATGFSIPGATTTAPTTNVAAPTTGFGVPAAPTAPTTGTATMGFGAAPPAPAPLGQAQPAQPTQTAQPAPPETIPADLAALPLVELVTRWENQLQEQQKTFNTIAERLTQHANDMRIMKAESQALSDAADAAALSLDESRKAVDALVAEQRSLLDSQANLQHSQQASSSSNGNNGLNSEIARGINAFQQCLRLTERIGELEQQFEAINKSVEDTFHGEGVLGSLVAKIDAQLAQLEQLDQRIKVLEGGNAQHQTVPHIMSPVDFIPLAEEIDVSQVSKEIGARKSELSEAAPIPAFPGTVETAKAERRALKVTATEDAKQWIPLIEEEQKADQLDFRHSTSAQVQLEITSLTAPLPKAAEPDIGREIDALLESARLSERAVAEEIDAEEEEDGRHIDAADVARMAGDIARVRAHMSYEQARQAHRAKIKSHGYHKKRKAASDRAARRIAAADIDALAAIDSNLAEIEAQRRVQHQRHLADHADDLLSRQQKTQAAVWRMLEREADTMEAAQGVEESSEPEGVRVADIVSRVREAMANRGDSDEDEPVAPALPEIQASEVAMPNITLSSSRTTSEHAPVKEESAEESSDAEEAAVRLDFDGVDAEDGSQPQIAENLAEDNAEDEFMAAREKLIERELPKVAEVDEILVPGWGAWAGDGAPQRRVPDWVRATQERQREARAKALSSRRDQGKPRVIISAQTPVALKAHQMRAMPRGVFTTEELEERLSGAVGSEFSTETAHRDAIKPRVLTRAGEAVAEMSYEKDCERLRKARETLASKRMVRPSVSGRLGTTRRALNQRTDSPQALFLSVVTE